MPSTARHILFITSNRVGDAVLSLGVLGWLVDSHPEARFTIACGPYAADLFRAVPRLERLAVLRKQSWNRHWLGLWRDCLPTKWDIIVDLRNSAVSRLLFADRRFYKRTMNTSHKVAEIASALALDPPPAPRVWIDDAAAQKAAQLIPAGKRVLALGPAANWPPKQWPIEKFTELTARLTAPDGPLADAPVLVLADTREREQVAELLLSIPPERRIEVIGQDLLTAAACLQRCALFVGNDSGLMHLAAAAGTPTLGLFGPGYEDIYGPWGAHCAFIRTPESREALLARLPNMHAREPNLMQGLEVESVAAAARALLQRAAQNASAA